MVYSASRCLACFVMYAYCACLHTSVTLKIIFRFLTGGKRYRATVKLGIQTNTLDLDPKGFVVEEKPFDHITSWKQIHDIVPQFTGTIKQVPPIFSALRKDGKRLHELGRAGQTAEDVKIEPREVTIYDLKILEPTVAINSEDLETTKMEGVQTGEILAPISSFQIEVECGGGTYIRSLIRDIGIALNTVATMSALERTKQGQFLLDDDYCMPKDDWSPESIKSAIEYCSKNLVADDDTSKKI
jgi:tRNA pseudouridine55 synthase